MIKVTATFKTMLGEGKTFQRTFNTICRKEHTAKEAVTDYIVYRLRGFDVRIINVEAKAKYAMRGIDL